MTRHKVVIDDYSWFDVMLDERGEPQQVIECRVAWSPRRDPDNKMMSERIKRAIEQARRALEH